MTMLATRLREAGRAEAMPSPADPEVAEQPKRRRFSAAYKARILAEADACSERGQIGSLLRREGLYSSHLSACGASSAIRGCYRRWGGRGAARRRTRWRRRTPSCAGAPSVRRWSLPRRGG